MDQVDMFDWEVVLVAVIAAFTAIVTLRIVGWLFTPRRWFTVSGRRVILMPRDPPEVLSQKMADSIVDWLEDKTYRKEVTPDKAMFTYELLANILGDKDYLPKGEKLLRERLTKILNPPTTATEAVSTILSRLQTKKA